MSQNSERFENDSTKGFSWNQKILVWVTRLFSAVMIACLIVPIIIIGGNILPGWKGWYLIPIVFFVSLESMYSHHRTHHLSILSLEWWISRVTELVVLLVLVKLLLYGVHGFGRLYTDVPLWREDFFGNFFDVEYSLVAIIVVGIWVISGDLDHTFSQIVGDQKLLSVEFDTGHSEQRQEIRQRLANIIIFCGGIMVVLIAILNINHQFAPNNIQVGVIAVLIYFVCGLVLLSITQYSILRVRWVIYQVPIERKITTRWYLFSLLLIAILAVLALFLPTAYSSELLGYFQWLMGILINLIATIVYLLTLPFILFFGWIMSLFKRNTSVQIPIRPELPPLPEPNLSQPSSWFTLLRTLIFWAILIGFVIFAFYYYLREHPEYFAWMKTGRLFKQFKIMLTSFLEWIRGINRQVGLVIQDRIERLRSRGSKDETKASSRYTNPKHMSPRQQIIFYYLSVIRRAEESGIPRGSSQTPNEYESGLNAYLTQNLDKGDNGIEDQANNRNQQAISPEITINDIHKITHQFMEARYSQHPITIDQAGSARNAWERILRIFRRLKLKD